jgi:hypothetical protein
MNDTGMAPCLELVFHEMPIKRRRAADGLACIVDNNVQPVRQRPVRGLSRYRLLGQPNKGEGRAYREWVALNQAQKDSVAMRFRKSRP